MFQEIKNVKKRVFIKIIKSVKNVFYIYGPNCRNESIIFLKSRL